MIPVSQDEILSRFAGIPATLKTLHKLDLAITCKTFHPDKTGSPFCTAGIPLCRDKIFPCNCFSPPRRDKKVNYRRYFYCVFATHITSICEKKSLQISLENFIIIQKAEEFCKRGVLKNFAIFTGKHLYWSLFADLQVCNFIKKRLQSWCFPVNTAKFLRTHILKNICERLLLILWKNIGHSWRLNNSYKNF